ncbi:ABC transporter permease [Jannaschia seohaensis]|uniref:Putative thiamine transport system permease protein n=1 Tax=Jannaschia seohaensis TaxID=475081 RepID=A0A2Y9AAW3_9RHOB|nr:ABC transporter permease subunit [Jannaschia seohaensis]PWJ20895.1 putative thiamine transport system permease protein [Jannaschia seohaensis]SSA41305.1 putative thiamine transport system permease protein [Jannaschia seohaensis]
MLRPLPLLTAAVLSLPVAVGLLGTVLPAIGLGAVGTGLSAEPFRAVLDWPGLTRAMAVSVSSGLLSTLGALLVATLILAGWQGTRAFVWLERMLSPLLAVPHAAAALGLAFLIAPSGWIARVPALVLGWDRPPDLLILQDPWGLSLTAGLIAKELPFLLLMMLAALGQTDQRRRMAVARSLGQGRIAGWLKTVFPALYAQVRLPVLVVLVYAMTNVDVALILGPNVPPTLSVQVTRWMAEPDLSQRAVAAAGAAIQFALVLGALAVWWGGERAVARLGCAWVWAGRGLPERSARAAGLVLGVVSALAVLLGIAALALWSVAAGWRFPELGPDALTARSWMRFGPEMLSVAGDTLTLAAAATALSLLLVVGCLEAEHRFGLTVGQRALWLLYLPLLIPQVAFLPGLVTAAAAFGLGPSWTLVALGHVVFVLPYVFLSLAGPFRAWDGRLARVGAGLGASPDAVLWRLRLPMLLAPVLTAAAVGMAVSVGQYLPTLLLGGGRVVTLATEAVALAAGGDRRAIGVWGLGQTGAAFLPFALALLVPALVWRNRRGLRHG